MGFFFKSKALTAILVVSLMAGLFGTGYALIKKFLPPQLTAELTSTENQDNALKDRLNFLLLGMDCRPGETKSRTDTMILVSVDKNTNRMAMMSIPRDTRVEIPGHGQDKINSANVYGGPEMATQVVSDLIGVPIDYYVVTNFNGFKDIVEALGGLDFTVERNMYYRDTSDGTVIDLKKGTQHLDGDKALQFVRFRNYPNGDVERTMYQQKFMKALAEEMLQPSTVAKLYNVVPSVYKNVQTNLGMMDMVSLAKAAKNLSSAQVVTQTVPGKFMTISGVSYWQVEPYQANAAFVALLNGEKTKAVQGVAEVQETKTVTSTPKVVSNKTKTTVTPTPIVTPVEEPVNDSPTETLPTQPQENNSTATSSESQDTPWLPQTNN